MLIRGRAEFAPLSIELYKSCPLGINNTDQSWKGRMDPFGINWVAMPDGIMPEPRKFLFEKIYDWKEHVHFHDVDILGIEKMAEIESAGLNRDEHPVNVLNLYGLFERMAAFMGFENTLCALMEGSHNCNEFFSPMADNKIVCYKGKSIIEGG